MVSSLDDTLSTIPAKLRSIGSQQDWLRGFDSPKTYAGDAPPLDPDSESRTLERRDTHTFLPRSWSRATCATI